jgi:hypothetical protein
MLFSNIINIAKLYMGPAAEAFIKRQIKGHLKIEPEMLNNQHVNDLAKWCQVSAGLLMEKEKAREFGEKIRELV